MEAYKVWARKNQDRVRSLESLANLVTWILPEQFGNSEAGAEAVYALLGIVSRVNKHAMEPSDGHKKESHTPWPLLLSLLRSAEAVAEVTAQHYVGGDRKWRYLAVTEAVKACVRLAAFRQSGYRMLLQGGEGEHKVVEEEDIIIVHGVEVKGVPFSNPVNGYPQNGDDDIGSNGKAGIVVSSEIPEGKAMVALGEFDKDPKMTSVDPMWKQPAVTKELLVGKPMVNTRSSWKGTLFMFGEAVHIVRPLLYVLMVTKFGVRSWRPWLVSLAAELASLGIQSHATDNPSHGSAEMGELKRRKMLCALYILRDPFFANYTRRHLATAEAVLNPKPLIFLGKITYMVDAFHSRYTYTSGS